ncbi:MAG: Hdr-like menaquinol oxidoreductase cytochrome c subunit [Gammaproteobacteria bacterium]
MLKTIKVITGMAALLISSAVFAGDSLLPSYPQANASATAEGRNCVEPNDVMRRQHFSFIMHQRDETVHRGIRTKKHSLKGCVDCHSAKDDSGTHIPVNTEGQFCSSCHEYAAVKIDCFECHATVPAEKSAKAGK